MNTIDELLEDLRQGRMVVVMDDEERENEGDLVMAAERVRAEDVNFMARYGRGLICLTLTRGRCRQLRLPLMVSDTDQVQMTNFTVSIEASEGVTTGISAYDRALTIRTAVRRDACPEDLRQPGHVFPLMAQPGGVLTRAGHTEAGCDLARLAGFEPAAVIVEILNEDGSMARRPDLERFAGEHRLKIGSIADLIRYRLRVSDRTVERISDQEVETEFGRFRMCWYEDHVHRTVHAALVKGDPTGPVVPLVRVHLKDTLRDVIGVRADGGWTLRGVMQRIASEPAGVVIILRQLESARDIMESVRTLGAGGQQEQAAPHPGGTVLRTYGVGAQILQDLGVRRMRVLSSPKQMLGISAFDLEITEYVD